MNSRSDRKTLFIRLEKKVDLIGSVHFFLPMMKKIQLSNGFTGRMNYTQSAVDVTCAE